MGKGADVPMSLEMPSSLKLMLSVWIVVLLGAGLFLFQSPLNQAWMLYVHSHDMGPDALWSFATQFGDAGTAFLLLLVVSQFAPHGASLTLKCLLLGSVVSRLLKTWVFSPRPLGVLDPALLHTIGMPPNGPNSMPSGHAMTIAAAVCLVLLMFPRAVGRKSVWMPLILGGSLVAFSRVVVGAHWPADVLVGSGLGLAVAWLAWAWEQKRSWSERLNSPNGQYLLLLVELGMAIYLFSSATDTEAARWAFDLTATVGMAGAMSRYARLRRQAPAP